MGITRVRLGSWDTPPPAFPPSLSRQDLQGSSLIWRKLAFRHEPRAEQ